MRRILTSVVLLVLLFPSLALGETMDDLVITNGLYFKKFTNVPFTGKVTGKTQGKIKNGKKVGPWVIYNTKGWMQFQGTHKNNKRHGSWVSYHSNGRILEKGTYKNGGKDGSWVIYHSNGRISEKGTYKNGEKDGPWVEYNRNGRISTEVTYSDGKWKEGTRVTYSYYGNRQLKSKGTLKDGKRVGPWVRYRENGQLHFKGTYNKGGEMHGPWVTYTKDGTVIEKYTGTFKNDKKISD